MESGRKGDYTLKRSESYLQKSAQRPALISSNVSKFTELFIVIPVFKEQYLLSCLESLNNCEMKKRAEVIVLFNAPLGDEAAIRLNKETKISIEEWIEREQIDLLIHLIEENELDPKEAGVGLARKLGMDEAVRRAISVGNPQAIISCLDADCIVSTNYIREILGYFQKEVRAEAVTIHFEHPLEGVDFDSTVYELITYYELHLRYFKHAMEFIGLPYDRYTVGSSMAVSIDAYVKEGGMNKRKAGEDFYFLQKYMINESLGEINKATVFPSPRQSDRVPFGTGRAILDHQDGRKDLHYSYSARSFQLLKNVLDKLESNYPEYTDLGLEFNDFLKDRSWKSIWDSMKTQSKDWSSFRARFLQWFTPFRLLKFVHFLRDHYYPNGLLVKEANELLVLSTLDAKVQLLELRERDKSD